MPTSASPSSRPATRSVPRLTGRQKVGVGLAGFYAVTNLPSVLVPMPEGEVGPPYAVLVFCTVMGVVGVLALVPAWRGNGVARRVLAGSNVLVVLTALPAFFVDVPLSIKALTAFSVLWVVVSIGLMFSRGRSVSTLEPSEPTGARR